MSILTHRWCVGALVVLLGVPGARAQWTHLGAVTSCERGEAVLTLQCGTAAVRIEAVNEYVVRVRLASEGRFGRDYSWAVTDLTPKGRFVTFEDGPDQLRATTGALAVVVHRNPCRLEVLDAEGHLLTADEQARGMAWCVGEKGQDPLLAKSSPGGSPSQLPSSSAVRVWQHLPGEVAIYGLGEKTGPLNKNGRAWTMWNTDTPAYGPSTDPLYKSVPFFIVAREGRYHGVFFDNPWRTSFDFGQLDRDVLSFGAEGGELNYYVIAGPGPKDVVQRYTDLTGRIELPPKWAIGYHQCRHSYFPEARVREIAATFREKKIPCDVLYFDIEYMNGHRCFTWNPEWFPDPAGLMADLHRMGFHTVAIIDPGIGREPGYFVYDEGTKIGAWLTKPDGEAYVGKVWP
ncbi:MAG: TIM-barrel domain-containing protein, partial [Planctomycetota bacterium]